MAAAALKSTLEMEMELEMEMAMAMEMEKQARRTSTTPRQARRDLSAYAVASLHATVGRGRGV
jgi:hypothetical protein